MAGVSPKTVSRVVNRDPNVKAATRERIEAVIRDAGYQVNRAARSLAGTRSYLIGAFMPAMPSLYYAEIFRGAAKACHQFGYNLVVEEFDHEDGDLLERYEQGLRGARCDALILTPPACDDERLLAVLDRDGMPYVRIAPAKSIGQSAIVNADDSLGVRQLVEHLWATGRRRYAVIGGPVDHAATIVREACFAETLAEMGGKPSGIRIVRSDLRKSLSESGREATLQLLRDAEPPPDAIFAFNDEIAIGAMAAVREHGLTIPDDIAIAGFDDSYAAQLFWPPLTTIHQPIADLAFHAVSIIANENIFDGNKIVLPTKLIVRETA